MPNEANDNDEEQPTTEEQPVETEPTPVETDGSGKAVADAEEDEGGGLRRRTVIAATLGSPAMFGLGFAGADYLGLSGSSDLENEGSASLSEQAMAGLPIIAQMDATAAEIDEEPAQDVPTNQYRTLHASEEVLDTLEREPGDQVRVTRGEDSAVFTLAEMEEVDEIDDDVDDDLVDDDEDDDLVDDDENDTIDDEDDDLVDDDENDEVDAEVDDEDDEVDAEVDDEDEDDDEDDDLVDDDEDDDLVDDEDDNLVDDEEDDEVDDEIDEEAEEDAIVRATREGKCRIAFYDENDFQDERRWGPLRGDDNCELADQQFEVEIHPRVPLEEDELDEEVDDDIDDDVDDTVDDEDDDLVDDDENDVVDDEDDDLVDDEDDDDGILDDDNDDDLMDDDEDDDLMDDDNDDDLMDDDEDDDLMDDDEDDDLVDDDEDDDLMDDDEDDDLVDDEDDDIDPEVDDEVDEDEAREQHGLVEMYTEGETELAVLAPHGGQIQPFTADQANDVHDQIEGSTLWTLEGYGQNTGYHRWYVPSAEFSPVSYPQLAELMDEEYDHAVSFHGVHDDRIYVGGTADEGLRQDIVDEIEEALPHDGSPVELGTHPYAAESEETLVNRVTNGDGGGIWIGQPISDRRDNWDTIAEAVASVLEDEVDNDVDDDEDDDLVDDDEDDDLVDDENDDNGF